MPERPAQRPRGSGRGPARVRVGGGGGPGVARLRMVPLAPAHHRGAVGGGRAHAGPLSEPRRVVRRPHLRRLRLADSETRGLPVRRRHRRARRLRRRDAALLRRRPHLFSWKSRVARARAAARDPANLKRQRLRGAARAGGSAGRAAARGAAVRAQVGAADALLAALALLQRRRLPQGPRPPRRRLPPPPHPPRAHQTRRPAPTPRPPHRAPRRPASSPSWAKSRLSVK
mmetsp:Transcript_1448/g.4247  ORF Transcript_1448/g.4247 Transcript_1448/m.4247 type:complete len:229 (-) Transcript_1448:127-813(-)